ncbi:MAG: VCBS repeat-containing protein, partial [Candidatus Omnitrophica bacterium]|nr:VCBS repeat-containing protein [Candidatus Omnitrophota bacterium]
MMPTLFNSNRQFVGWFRVSTCSTFDWAILAILSVTLTCNEGFATNPTPLPTPEAIWQAKTPVANPTYDTDQLPEGHAFKVQWGNSLPSGPYWLYRRLEPTQTWDLVGPGQYDGSGAYEYPENSFLNPGQYYYKVQQLGSALERTDEGTPQPGWIGGMRIATRTPTSAPTAYGTAPACGPYTPYRFVMNDSIMKPTDAEVGDVDGDGDFDLIFAKGVGNELVWYENQNGSFSISNRYLISAYDYSIAAEDDSLVSISPGDLDDDGDIDIVASYGNDDNVVWYESDGASVPTFTLRLITASESISSVSTVDINNDGNLDIVTLGASGAAYFLNDGETDPTFTRYTISTSQYLRTVTVANVRGDNDGYPEIITASANPGPLGTIEIYENPEELVPTFPSPEVVINDYDFRDPSELSFGDMDGDGDIDLVAASNTFLHPYLYWFENCECPSGFTMHLITDETVVWVVTELRTIDFDNDGDLDIFANARENQKMFWFDNDGEEDPTFEKKTIFDDIFGIRAFDLEDLDSDDLPDIAYCAWHLYPSVKHELGWIENTNNSPCPTLGPTETPTPTNLPTPNAIWEQPPDSSFPDVDKDFVATTDDYSVHFGGNIPNLPSRYSVKKRDYQGGTFTSINPTLTYSDDTNSFSFNDTVSVSIPNPQYRVETTDWEGTPIPGYSVQEDTTDPRPWMQGVLYYTPIPTPIPTGTHPPFTPITFTIESTKDYASVNELPDLPYWPVTTAIPFAPGDVFEWHIEGFRVKDSSGALVPAQFRIKERWPDSSESIRWVQIDFEVTPSDIVSESQYTLIYDPSLDTVEPASPVRVYENLDPLFQLDFEHPSDPTIALISDPGKEKPLNALSIPNEIGCGYGYDPEGMGSAMDATNGDTHLTYQTNGNLDMSHGTIEFWYKPNWSINPVTISKEPSVFSLYDPTATALNSLKIYFLLTQGTSAEFRVWLGDDTPGSPRTLSTQVFLSASNWNDRDWNHLAVSWDSSQGLRAFLNGKLLDSDRQTFNAYDESTTDVPSNFTLGFYDWGYPDDNFYALGYIDDFRIFEDFTEELTFTQQTLRLSFDDFYDGIPEVPVSRGFIREAIPIEKINPTLTPTPISREELGVQNSALAFYGNEYLKVPNNGVAYPRYLGVDFWFRVDDETESQALFQIHTTTNPHLPTDDDESDGMTCRYIPGTPSTIEVKIDDGEGGAPQPITLSVDMDSSLINSWHHLTFLARDYNLPTLKCDFDEVEIPPEEGDWETDGGFKLVLDGGTSESYEAWHYPLNLFPSKEIWIGALYDGTSMMDLEGAIDEFRVWNYPRMPREKASVFCGDAHYQIRMDRMNYLDLVQHHGKVLVDSRDVTGGATTPGFIVEDKKVLSSDRDEFYTAYSSYYSPTSLYDGVSNSNKNMTVYHAGHPNRRIKVNDFKIRRGPVRTSVEVRSLGDNGKSGQDNDQSGYGISRYDFSAGLPFLRNDFTFVITKPSNPDPMYVDPSGTPIPNDDARKYFKIALRWNVPSTGQLSSLHFGYNNLSGTPNYKELAVDSSNEDWVYTKYNDQLSQSSPNGLFLKDISQPPIGWKSATRVNMSELYKPDALPQTPPLDTQYRPIWVTSVDGGAGNIKWCANSSESIDSTLMFTMRDFHAMHPKVIEDDPLSTCLELWGYRQRTYPFPADEAYSLSQINIRHMFFAHIGSYEEIDSEDRYLLDFSVPSVISQYDYNDLINYDQAHAEFSDAIGVARTHEMFFSPVNGEADDTGNHSELDKMQDIFQSQVFAIPNREFFKYALPGIDISPYQGDSLDTSTEVKRFLKEIDSNQKSSFDNMLANDLRVAPPGLFNVGGNASRWRYDLNTWDDTYRTWAGNHHGIPRSYWIMFFRTGDPKYLQHALKNSLKLTDTFWIHWDGRSANTSGIKYGDKVLGNHNKYNGIVP